MNDTSQPLLSVRDLHIDYRTGAGRTVKAIRGVDFDLYPHQSLALVGESGCGKSTLALGLLRLLPKLGKVSGGSVTYRQPDGDGYDVLKLGNSALRQWRWSEVAMVFQGAMNAFNPVLTIGLQIMEPLRIHLAMSEGQARERALELLSLVGITDGPRRP